MGTGAKKSCKGRQCEIAIQLTGRMWPTRNLSNLIPREGAYFAFGLQSEFNQLELAMKSVLSASKQEYRASEHDISPRITASGFTVHEVSVDQISALAICMASLLSSTIELRMWWHTGMHQFQCSYIDVLITPSKFWSEHYLFMGVMQLKRPCLSIQIQTVNGNTPAIRRRTCHICRV
jgi:hypothetical protein